MTQPQINEKHRLASPATTPQALAWDRGNRQLWIGSRDLRRIYAIDPENGTVLKQQGIRERFGKCDFSGAHFFSSIRSRSR
jgi:hypothetical protein